MRGLGWTAVQGTRVVRFSLRHDVPAIGWSDCACGQDHLALGPTALWGSKLCGDHPYGWHSFAFFGAQDSPQGVADLLERFAGFNPLESECAAEPVWTWLRACMAG